MCRTSSLEKSIICPIFKKGNQKEPANYSPISLLDIYSKIYARHLLNTLEDWEEETKLFHPEQAGGCKRRSVIDHRAALKALIQKYISWHTKQLYVTFIDLTSAFDSTDWSRLWEKLARTAIDKCLLKLIMELTY